jgi:hypothetical protein
MADMMTLLKKVSQVLVPQCFARVLRTACLADGGSCMSQKKPGACPGEFRKSGGDLQQSFGAVAL